MNRHLLNIICTLSLSWMTTALYSMECALAQITKQQKERQENQAICGKLYLDSQGVTAYYISQKYHEENIATIGVRSSIEDPVVEVTLEFTEINTETNTILSTFPQCLPITCFFNARTGTNLHYTIGGRQISLTCCNTPGVQECFESKLNGCISCFVAIPRVLCLPCRHNLAQKCGNRDLCPANRPTEFVEKGLLKAVGNEFVQYKFGENGFNNLYCYLYKKLLNSSVAPSAIFLLSALNSLENQHKKEGSGSLSERR